MQKAGCIGGRVEQVNLEAVQILDPEHHADFASMFGDLLHALDAPLPFVGRRAGAGELADRRMIRADQGLAAGGRAAIERALGGGDAGGPNFGIRADRIVGSATHGDRRSFESQIVEPLAPGGIVEAQIEQRNLDAVVAQLLDLFEHRQQAVMQTIGPQQKVHSEFHRVSPICGGVRMSLNLVG